MRDAEKLCEQPVRWIAPRTVVWCTFLALGVCGAIFSLGFVIGGRMARLDIAHEPLLDPIARLDVQRQLHDELTFYDDLTAKARPQSPGGAKPPTTAPSLDPVAKVKAPTDRPAAANPGRSGPSRAPASVPQHAPLGLRDGPAQAGEYTLQVRSYPTAQQAQAFCLLLERKGLKPSVVKGDLGGRGTWYRVRVGRFVDATQAKQAKATLAQDDLAAWVLRVD